MDSLLWMVPSREIAAPAVIVFRTKFHLETEREFHLRWTADEHADLFLNGQYFCDGPQRGTPKRWFLEENGRLLAPGDYTLTVRVLKFGGALTAHAQRSSAFGFYAESDLLSGEWEWQEVSGIRWTASFPDWAMYPRAEVLAPAGFHFPDGGEEDVWEPVAYRRDSRPLFPRSLPPMERVPEHRFRTVARPGGGILFVFDTYVCVWSDFRFRGTGSVVIRWTESLYEPGTFDSRELTGDKGDRRVFEGKEWIGNGTRLQLPGGSVRWCDFWWKAGRYLLLEFTGTAALEDVSFFSTGYPWKREWNAKTSLPELDHALELAWHTLKMCSHDTFLDCPFFEQLQYVSDSRLEALTAFVTARDTRLIRSALRAFADSQAENGIIFSRTPSKQVQVIPSFALIYILFLRDFSEWRGPDEIQEFLPCARGILRYFAGEAENGLLHFPGWDQIDTPDWKAGDRGWNFIDWVSGWKDGVPPGDCALNLFYLLALEAMEKLDPVHAEFYGDAAQKVAAAIRAAYEVPGTGFADDEAHRSFSEHAQILAVLSERLPDYAPDLPGASEASVSFSYYYLEAVRRLGRADLFRRRLEKWFGMEKAGLCTLPENFDNPRSDCHAWSSHILHHYFATVLGLRPLDAAAGCWNLDPFPAGLNFAEGEIPLGSDRLQIRLELAGTGKMRLSYAAPADIHLCFRGKKLDGKKGYVEFPIEN